MKSLIFLRTGGKLKQQTSITRKNFTMNFCILLDLLDNLRIQPGHVERITPTQAQDDEDTIAVQRFLKLNVRHITDGQGVVGGVLLVTPNAVMFDPNVSDPLVIEHGPESYGVIAPMEFIVNSAIFNDIAHMRVGSSNTKSGGSEKPEVYFPCKPDESIYPELRASSVDQESNCSTERDGDAFPKAFERDLVTPVDKSQHESNEICDFVKAERGNDEKSPKNTIEERRQSLIDQHWAIPSKDR